MKSYRINYVDSEGGTTYQHVNKVFSGWDATIMSEETAQLKHKTISNELKVYI